MLSLNKSCHHSNYCYWIYFCVGASVCSGFHSRTRKVSDAFLIEEVLRNTGKNTNWWAVITLLLMSRTLRKYKNAKASSLAKISLCVPFFLQINYIISNCTEKEKQSLLYSMYKNDKMNAGMYTQLKGLLTKWNGI